MLFAKWRLRWSKPRFGNVKVNKALVLIHMKNEKIDTLSNDIHLLLSKVTPHYDLINIIENGKPEQDTTYSLSPGKEKNRIRFPQESSMIINLTNLLNDQLEWEVNKIQAPVKIRFDRNYVKFYNFIFLSEKADVMGKLAYFTKMTDKLMI